MRTCPICENDLERCQCAPSDKVVYLVVWSYDVGWDIEPMYIDSVWTDEALANRRLELLRRIKGERAVDFEFGVFAVRFDEMGLLESANGIGQAVFGRSLVNL